MVDAARAIVLVTFPDYDTQHEAIGGALTSAGLEIRLAPKSGAARSRPSWSDLLIGAVGAIRRPIRSRPR